jgi:damage-control phosphatase, subfamily I
MRAAPECYPCFLSQAVKTARMAVHDPRRLKALLDEVSEALRSRPFDVAPPVISEDIYRIIARVTGDADPYRALKRRCVRQALRLYPGVKARAAASPDPLRAAVQAAIAGNVIDFGVSQTFDLAADIAALLDQPLAVDHYPDFRRSLARARRVLFLGDNAGETVFDRILVEALDRPVDYAVRSAPIINDALAEDAAASGLAGPARIVESGCRTPGTILSGSTPAFRRLYRAADLIISKGQGNFESLSESGRPVFFLLKIKCGVVARLARVPEGSLVLISQRRRRKRPAARP